MTQAQEKYLRILRAALWNIPCPLPVTDEIINIAHQQSTTGLICSQSENLNHRDEKIKIIWHHDKTNTLIAKLFTILEDAGVPCVLLKGQGNAHYYLIPELRCCGDIDIYVGEENYSKAVETISSIADKNFISEESEHHYQTSCSGIVVELHKLCLVLEGKKTWSTFLAYSKKGLSENLVPVDLGTCTVNTPADDFNVIYIFSHAFHHFLTGGVGLRHLCDWAMLLHAKYNVIDKDLLLSRLKELNLLKDWQQFGYIAVNYLGLPEEEMPFYTPDCARRSKVILEKIFEDGNFGRAKNKGLVDTIDNAIVKKPLAFFVYTLKFFKYKALNPRHVHFSRLIEMYRIGFSRALRRKK